MPENVIDAAKKNTYGIDENYTSFMPVPGSDDKD